MKKMFALLVVWTVCVCTSSFVGAQDIPGGLLRTYDGKGFYHHRFRDVEQKPYIDFLGTPGGNNILRDMPPDHYHHHGLMMAIRINGVNFWEESGYPGKEQITSAGVRSKIDCTPNGTFVDESLALNWITPRGTLLLEEQRLIRAQRKSNSDPTLMTWLMVFSCPDSREQAGINPEIVPPDHSAELDEKTTLHGSYYNGFGLRFDETMDFGGRFFYSEGSEELPIGHPLHTNVLCRWAAYTAKLHGQPVTVALYDLGGSVTSKDVLKQKQVFQALEQDILKHPFALVVDEPKIKSLPMVVYALGDPTEQRTNAYLSATMNIFREPLELAKDQSVVLRYGIAIWDGERTPQEVEEVLQAWERSRNGK